MYLLKKIEIKSDYKLDSNYIILNDNLIYLKDRNVILNINTKKEIDCKNYSIKDNKIAIFDGENKTIIDENLNMLIPKDKYDVIYILNDKFIFTRKNNLNIIYDEYKNIVSEFRLDKIYVEDFNNGNILIKQDDKKGIINIFGNTVIPLDKHNIVYLNDGNYKINSYNYRMVINKEGNEIFKIKGNKAIKNYIYDSFNNNIITRNSLNDKFTIYFKNKPLKKFDRYEIINDELINIKIGDKNYIFDKNGNDIKSKYELLYSVNKNYLTSYLNGIEYLLDNNLNIILCGKLVGKTDEYLAFSDNNILSIININNKDIKKYEYEKIKITPKFWKIKSNDKTIIINPYNLKEYEMAYELNFINENYATYENNSKIGLYDLSNKKVITDALYDYIKIANETYFIVKIDNKYGVIDKNGNIIIDTLFDNIEYIGNDNFIIDNTLININDLKINYKIELYDDNKNIICVRKYDNKEKFDFEYNYFKEKIENNKKRLNKYIKRRENEYKTNFKYLDSNDIKQIKLKKC